LPLKKDNERVLKWNLILFQIDPLKASFHIPLHRYFAVFLRQAVKSQGFTLQELLPDNDFLTRMMQHPLRVQVNYLLFVVYFIERVNFTERFMKRTVVFKYKHKTF